MMFRKPPRACSASELRTLNEILFEYQMTSQKPQVVVALLATCVLLANADSTTSSSRNETTSTKLYQMDPPDQKSRCENLTMDAYSKSYLLPSEMAVFKCSCKNENATAICPELGFSREALGKMTTVINSTETTNTSCSTVWGVGTFESAFNKRRVEAPVFCQAGSNTTESRAVIFEKQSDQEKCNEDVDCWIDDQMCSFNKCRCYNDTPSFVKMENKCYQASSYGQKCEHDEQCMYTDKHSTCNRKVCKCQEYYWTKSETDFTCTEDPKLTLSQEIDLIPAENVASNMEPKTPKSSCAVLFPSVASMITSVALSTVSIFNAMHRHQ